MAPKPAAPPRPPTAAVAIDCPLVRLSLIPLMPLTKTMIEAVVQNIAATSMMYKGVKKPAVS